ncbi:MAG: hypothetical protein L0Y76_06815, partial [Ignavibacteria bacterium]|nr:hypothetical protein [Ignavibacteria bacterium]
QNFDLTFNTTPLLFDYPFFSGIMYTLYGNLDIGNTAGNIIGGNSTNGSINISFTGTTSYIPEVNFIEHSVNGSVSNNQIGSANISSVSTISNGIVVNGIKKENTPSSEYGMTGNIIGSTSVPNSINFVTSVANCMMNGINIISNTSAGNISYNSIANLNNGSSASLSYIRGIYAEGTSVFTVNNNTIDNISTISQNQNGLNSDLNSSAGIILKSSGLNQNVSGNIIKNINSSTAASVNNLVTGISLNNSSASGTVSRNRIYNLLNSSTGASPVLSGIKNYAGNWAVSNNQVTLTNGEASDNMQNRNNEAKQEKTETDFSTNGVTIYGIYDNSASAGSYYFNTVYTGGSASTGNADSYSLYRAGTNYISLKNNLLY